MHRYSLSRLLATSFNGPLCLFLFVAGVVFGQYFAVLPGKFSVLVVILVLVFVMLGGHTVLRFQHKLFNSGLLAGIAFLLGLFYLTIHVEVEKQQRLPPGMIKKKVMLVGIISTLPQQQKRFQQFIVHAERLGGACLSCQYQNYVARLAFRRACRGALAIFSASEICTWACQSLWL